MEVKCGVKKALSSCSFLELSNNLHSYHCMQRRKNGDEENLINRQHHLYISQIYYKAVQNNNHSPASPTSSPPIPVWIFSFDFSSFQGLREKSMRKGTMGS
jgi:hypothetical protein